MSHTVLRISILLAICTPLAAAAQSPLERHGLLHGQATHVDMPNEHVDPLSGNLILVQTDLTLPGNAGLDLRVQRVYNSQIYPDYAAGSQAIEEDSWAGIGWKLHFGRVIAPGVPESGVTQIEMGDGSRHPLYSTNAHAEQWITKGFWLYDRSNHTLKLPGGVVYTFGREVYVNARIGHARYVTEIRDQYGNRIEFEYFGAGGPVDGTSRIRQFVGSQVREVTFTHDAENRLQEMHYDGRVWRYRQGNAGPAGHSRLEEVTPPAGPSWGYHHAGPTHEITTVTGPSGGEWRYQYSDVTQQTGSVATTVRAVTRRELAGRSIGPEFAGVWLYEYSQGANRDETLVHGACETTRYRFHGVGLSGDFSGWKAGLLAERRVERSWEIVEAETLTWQRGAVVSGAFVAGENGVWADNSVANALLTERRITRGSHFWNTTFDYDTVHYNNHGQPWRIIEDGELTRIVTRTFQTAFTPHIGSRVASETVTSGGASVASSWTYHLATGFLEAQNIGGFTTQFERHANGNLSAIVDGRGNRTTFAYDWGRVSEIRTPTTVRSLTVNPDGTVGAETVAGLTTLHTFDAIGRWTGTQPPGQTPILYDYHDWEGRRIERLIQGQTITRYAMDGFARPSIVISEATGLHTFIERDGCGRVTNQSAPHIRDSDAARGTLYLYDSLSRVVRTTAADTSMTHFAYEGNDVHVTDAEGRLTKYEYSSFGSPEGGRLTKVIDADNKITSYTYDVRGNLLTVTGPGTTPGRSWTYDSRGLVATETHPESGTTTYNLYDGNGNLLRVTDAAGAVTTFEYDADNRLLRRDGPGTQDDLTVAYDAAGRVATQSVPGASTSFTYNGQGSVATRTDQYGAARIQSTYHYDAVGNLTGITYPSGRGVTYAYDAENRLVEVRNNGVQFAHSFQYDTGGRLASYVTGQVTHAVTYDSRDRARTLKALGPAGGLDLTYSYDRLSQVTNVIDPRASMSQAFGYDVLGRLTAATGPWSALSWTYDAAGNRLTEARGSATTTYNYNAPTQRLQSTTGPGAESFTYDPVGRLTADSRGAYTYNSLGLMRTITASGVAADFQYDASGLRSTRTVNGATVYTARGLSATPLGEFEMVCGGVQWKRDLIYAGGRLLGAVRTNRPSATVAFSTASSTWAESSTSVTLHVRLTTPDGAPLPCAASVAYATQAGTATAGTDFTAASGTLSFASGTLSGATRAITIALTNDTAAESGETFSVVLSSPQGTTVVTPSLHTLTISDNDGGGTNVPPSVSLTSPANGASFTAPGTVSLAATAADTDGTIARVEFYAGTTLIASDTTSPYAHSWTNVGGGSYSLTAVAVDNTGASTTSAARTIAVQTPTLPGTLLVDDFNDNAIDTAKWDTADLFSGTENPAIQVDETGQRLAIGPLLANTTGSNYNGIDSMLAYDFTGAAASVELVQVPAPAAYALFTAGASSNNYYRFYVFGSVLSAQQRINGTKTDVDVPYDASAHRFLRIRHDAAGGLVVWETAPSVNGVPGAWTARRSETWNGTAVPVTSVRFELKAGTSDAQAAPGTAIFDNFRAGQAGTSSGASEVVIYASDVAAPQGEWRHVSDSSAADGVKLATANNGLIASAALASPASYFDVPFTATAGVRYRIWLRLRAVSNRPSNDSVWVQFSGAVNQAGQAVYRTGTTDALLVNLENCTGCGVSGWGWQNTSSSTLDTGEVWFASSGPQTVRVQVREDGVELDQIVISPGMFVDMAPGPALADATIVPRASGNEAPAAALTAPAHAASFVAPASIALSATASDSDGTVARVDFYANGTLVGTDTATPYACTSWAGVAAGTYTLAAVAVDNDGASTTSSTRTITVQAGSGSAETVIVADNFNDNSLSTTLWDRSDLFSGTETTSIPVAETGSQLRIGPLLSNTSGSQYAGVDTVQTYDMTGAAVSVELVQPPSTAAATYAMLTAGRDGDNYYRVAIAGSDLLLQREIAGVKHDVAVPYDAAAHRFWRIRHVPATGVVLFETAPGAGGVPGTWTVRRQDTWDTAAVPLTQVRLELKGGTGGAVASPGTVIFDNFKVASGGFAVETVLLSEEFGGTSLDTSKWTVAVQSGTQDSSIPVAQGSGQLSIGPLLAGASGSHYNGILSIQTFDLASAAVSVEAVTAPAASTTGDMMLTVTLDGQHHYRMFVEQGALRLEVRTLADGKEPVGGAVTFSATTHAYWRIRHDVISDEVVFETAPKVGGAPGSWVERGRTVRAFATAGVRVELKAGTWQPEASAPGTVRFDSVKVVR